MNKHSKKNKKKNAQYNKATKSKKSVNLIHNPSIRSYKIISTNNVNFMMKKLNQFIEIDTEPKFAKPLSIYDGILIIYKHQAYIDLGVNSYIPVFNTNTGEILVSSI